MTTTDAIEARLDELAAQGLLAAMKVLQSPKYNTDPAQRLVDELTVRGVHSLLIAPFVDEVSRLRQQLQRTEDMARGANAECIKHWNRADAAEAEREAALALVGQLQGQLDAARAALLEGGQSYQVRWRNALDIALAPAVSVQPEPQKTQ